ncbi:MAG: hypothetical protein WCA19_15990 [Candidatus Acidiferrales bacterium]
MIEDAASLGTMAHLVDGAGKPYGSGGDAMAALIKEEKYIAYIGTEEHVLRVQE